MINIVLAKLGQYVSAATTLTFIVLLHVLELVLFYNPQLKISEQGKRGVTQKGFGQWTKECENMEIYPPQKLTVLGLTYILLLTTSSLPAYMLL